MDAGERWTLNNVAGNPIRTWDSRGHQIRQTYDALQRPTHLYVKGGNHGQEILAEWTVYGEGIKDAVKYNLRGEVYQQYDGAGVVTNQEYDFKDNLKQSSRQLAQDYKQRLDWNRTVPLETETFTSKTAYDALDRPIWLKMPDKSEIKPIYNEANFLDKVEVRLRGATDRENQEEKPKWTEFVKNIEYDAKGQRTLIVYGNRVQTSYAYDRDTFRLTRLLTKGKDGKHLQDLHYTYDPVGNITEIWDDAQQKIFFNNQVVSPSSKYEYDALYRLIRAEGREHLGQTGSKPNPPKPTSDTDIPRVNLPHPGNGQAMGRYQQQYVYDKVGNILEMIHHGTNPEHPGWRRCYQYALDSNRLLSTGYQSNPLVSCETRYAAESVYPQVYTYDPHGNMIRMPHLANHKNAAANMHWDFEDQLQSVDLGGGGKAHYVYDAGGQRVRKVVEKGAGLIEERIYLGDFEIFRRRNGNGLKLERETLHIMDDQQRIALVETKTFERKEGGSENKIDKPETVIRYQLGNHLGSASLELDVDGAVISYEEYYPYGSTSYQGKRSKPKVSLKRYRYTGKERDEESGFYYHGARYYGTWLGRWISCDPSKLLDGINLYQYIGNNPNIFVDPSGRAKRNRASSGKDYKNPITINFSNSERAERYTIHIQQDLFKQRQRKFLLENKIQYYKYMAQLSASSEKGAGGFISGLSWLSIHFFGRTLTGYFVERLKYGTLAYSRWLEEGIRRVGIGFYDYSFLLYSVALPSINIRRYPQVSSRSTLPRKAGDCPRAANWYQRAFGATRVGIRKVIVRLRNVRGQQLGEHVYTLIPLRNGRTIVFDPTLRSNLLEWAKRIRLTSRRDLTAKVLERIAKKIPKDKGIYFSLEEHKRIMSRLPVMRRNTSPRYSHVDPFVNPPQNSQMITPGSLNQLLRR